MVEPSGPRRRLGPQGSPSPPRRVGGCRCLVGLGVPEVAVIAEVAAIAFGPAKLPDIGRGIGRTMKSFQEAAKEFEMELKRYPEDATEPPPLSESTEPVNCKYEKELEVAGTKESISKGPEQPVS